MTQRSCGEFIIASHTGAEVIKLFFILNTTEHEILTLVLRDPYRSGFAMHVCVAGYGSIRDRPVSSFTL